MATPWDFGRGDTNESQIPLLADELSDDSIEYDDEAIFRLSRSTSCYEGESTKIGTFSSIPAVVDDSTWRSRPDIPTVEERTDDILSEVTARIAKVSDGIKDLKAQTRNLSSDFRAQIKKLDDLKPLKRCYTTNMRHKIQQLEELNYLNGLIAFLQMADKEMVLLPCSHDVHGQIFPRESPSDSSGQPLSLAELGESYREFSSDESATGL